MQHESRGREKVTEEVGAHHYISLRLRNLELFISPGGPELENNSALRSFVHCDVSDGIAWRRAVSRESIAQKDCTEGDEASSLLMALAVSGEGDGVSFC